jgi:hypothetical protein
MAPRELTIGSLATVQNFVGLPAYRFAKAVRTNKTGLRLRSLLYSPVCPRGEPT